MTRLVSAALALLLLWTPAKASEDPARAAQEASRDLLAAAERLAEAERAGDRIAALTDTIRAYEDGLGALRSAIRDAAIRERALRAKLAGEDAALTRLLGALQGIGRSPETAVLLHPSGAESTVRAAMLMETLTPVLRDRVDVLRADLDELAVMTALREDARASLQAGLDGVQAARTALAQAVSDRAPLPPPLATDVAALQALLNSAETLDAFASSLVDAPDEASAQTFAAAKGNLRLPVPATVLTGFDQADAAGVRRPGLVLATLPAALVTAPWPATVRYAGPLLDYGNVVIVEPADGYLLILAGLGTLYTELGAVVDAGEPLGLVTGQSRSADQILNETSVGSGQDRAETLYMELRTGNGPEDPADWFALGRE